jgi:hypothetical protein
MVAVVIGALLAIGAVQAMASVQCAPQQIKLGPGEREFDIVAVFPDSGGPTTVDVVTSSPGLRVVGAPRPETNVTAGTFATSWNTLITMSLAVGAADGDYVITVRGVGADETACTIDVAVDTVATVGPVVVLPPDSAAAGDDHGGARSSGSVPDTSSDGQAQAPSGNYLDRMLDGLPEAGRLFVLVIGVVIIGGVALSLGALTVSVLSGAGARAEEDVEELPTSRRAKRRRGGEIDLDDLAGGTTRHGTPLPVEEPTPLFGPRKRAERVRVQRKAADEAAVAPLAVPDDAARALPDTGRRHAAPKPTLGQRMRTSGVGRAYLMRKARGKARKPSLLRRMRTSIARERAAATAPKWDPSTRPSLPAAEPHDPPDYGPDSVESAG